MEKNNQKFNSICEIEPPQHLKATVLNCIQKEQARKIRRKKVLFQISFVFSGILWLISSIFFGREIMKSDFWSIASLSFSDMEIILVHWQSFGLSLLETFPTIAVASMFAPMLLILVLMKKYADNRYMQTFKHANI